MARGIENFPNTDNSDPGNYPGKRIKDDPGDGTGTPINEFTNGDIHQFFFALMQQAGIAPNGQPENVTNGYQYILALVEKIRATIATDTLKGTVELATQAEVNTGTDTSRVITPATLAGYLGAWVNRSNVADITVTGGSGTAVSTSQMQYKIIGKTMHLNFSATITNSTAPTSFEVLIPGSKTYAAPFNQSVSVVIFDGSQQKLGRGLLRTTATGNIQVALAVGETFTNGETSLIAGTVTFEIA